MNYDKTITVHVPNFQTMAEELASMIQAFAYQPRDNYVELYNAICNAYQIAEDEAHKQMCEEDMSTLDELLRDMAY